MYEGERKERGVLSEMFRNELSLLGALSGGRSSSIEVSQTKLDEKFALSKLRGKTGNKGKKSSVNENRTRRERDKES